MLIVRSIIFNLLFYLNLCTLLLLAVPTLIMPQRAILWMAKTWGRSSLWLLRVICGLKVEFRGLEKITPGPLIVAAKHQSTFETMKLHLILNDPAIVLKQELLRIPIWGRYLKKTGMIPIDRSAGRRAVDSIRPRPNWILWTWSWS